MIDVVASQSLFSASKKAIQKIKPFVNDLKTEICVIVPDRFSLICEKTIMDVCNVSAVFNVNVMGITRLADKIVSQSQLNPIIVSKQQGILLVRKSILNVYKKFVCFKKNLSPSFCEEIFASISQLKANLISPETLKQEIKNEKALSKKLFDLATIYQEYQLQLAGRFDACEFLTLSETLLKNTQNLNNTILIFCGFDAITKQVFSFISALEKKVKQIVVAISKAKRQSNQYIYENSILDKILLLSKNNNVQVNFEDHDAEFNEFQKNILNCAFSNKRQILKNLKQQIFVSNCKTADDEVLCVAKQIKKLLMQNNKFSNISICCNLQKYNSKIERIFKQENYSYFIDNSQNFASSSLGLFIKKIFNFFIFQSKENLFEILKSNFIKIDKNIIFDYENYLLKTKINLFDNEFINISNELNIKITNLIKFNINNAQNSSFNYINNLINSEYKINLEQIKKMEIIKLNIVLKYFENIILKINEKNSINFYCEIINELFNFFEIENLLINNAIEFEKRLLLKEQKITMQLFSVMQNILQSFKIIDENISLSEFNENLKMLFEKFDISSVPVSSDSIFVGDVSASFFEERDFVFVLGANSNELPNVIADTGVISDLDQQKSSIVLEPTIQTLAKRNRFKLFEVLLKAKQAIFISHATVGDDGKNLELSNFASGLVAQFLDQNGNEFPVHETVYDTIFGSDCTAEKNAEKLAYVAMSKNEAKLFLQKVKKENGLNHVQTAITDAIKTVEPNFRQVEKLELPCKISVDAKLLFFAKNQTKISQIETYCTCPFKHFVQYGLKLCESETVDMDLKKLGIFLHAVAERFLKQNKNVDNLSINEIEGRAVKVFEEVCGEFEFFKGKCEKSFNQALKNDTISLCKAISYQIFKSDFKPEFLEVNFFDNSQIKPIQIDSFSLVGKIDRVDVCGDYFCVIDYKSGNVANKIKFSAIAMGTEIQLYIYQRAVEKSLQKHPAGDFLFPIKNTFCDEKNIPYKMCGYLTDNAELSQKMDKTLCEENCKSNLIPVTLTFGSKKIKVAKVWKFPNVINQNDFGKLADYSIQIASNAINESLQGFILPSPVFKACKNCTYKNMCGFCETIENSVREVLNGNVSDILEVMNESK
ncbi:MAG: PD-(D/E)XK nuclease family protein [Clostridia bacterium]